MRGDPVLGCLALAVAVALSCATGCGPADDETPAGGPENGEAPGNAGAPTNAGPLKNVVIVCVNCFRKDRVGVYSRSGHTPHLDAFAESGSFVFANLVSPATWTRPCLYELLTARDFRKETVHVNAALQEDTVVVDPEAVLPEGFLGPRAMRAAGRSGHRFLWVYQRRLRDVLKLEPVRQLNPPFVLFVHVGTLHDPYATACDSADSDAARLADAPASVRDHYVRAIDTVSRAGRGDDEGIVPRMPFFVAAFGTDKGNAYRLARKHNVHLGWLVNEQALSAWRSTPTYGVEIDILRRLYEANVRGVDAEFAELLRFLEARGLLDTTIVAVMGDHGEHLMEHGWLQHWMPYEEVINPPLIVKVPGLLEKTVIIEDQVRTRDVLPTLLDLAGAAIAAPARTSMDGRSVAGLFKGERVDITAFSTADVQSYAIRRNDGWKLIWHQKTGKKELYNVKIDPGESKDMAGTRPDIQAVLEEELLLYLLHTHGGP